MTFLELKQHCKIHGFRCSKNDWNELRVTPIGKASETAFFSLGNSPESKLDAYNEVHSYVLLESRSLA